MGTILKEKKGKELNLLGDDYMTAALTFVALCLIVFAITASITGFIPKKGRSMNTTGEEIIATIINNNNMAEKPTTLRAVDENGKITGLF